MSELPGGELLKCIRCGYRKAKAHACHDEPKTSSSRFVHEVAKEVHESYFLGHWLHAIGVEDSGERSSGEWLLDACITKDISLRNPHHAGFTRFIDSIVFAMESESDTGTPAFNTDFAKLLHLNAAVKLYLNGVNQSSEDTLEAYMGRRRKYVETILRTARHDGQFFFAFWPSPAQKVWRSLPEHLDEIRLWEWKGHRLSEVACCDGS